MANKASSLMGFHQIDNNKVHRSTFDLSRRNLFTSKIGELLPVFL
jgi:N-acetylglutamate synthase-like GNAT family acetyltransferase